MSDKPKCSIAECGATAYVRGWCVKHYERWRRHGDAAIERVRGVDYGVVTRSTCVAEECDRPELAKGWCTMHYSRVKKHGDPNAVARGGRPVKGAAPTFSAIHKRLARTRGKASAHECTDCSRPAREWSYDYSDPDELIGQSGRFTLRYSLDLTRYVPRCTSCHRKHDMAADNQVKALLDGIAGNRTRTGPVLVNDAQVVEIRARVDRGAPVNRVTVLIEEMTPDV